ncbi:MAG: hypothetical protein PHI91_00865 [Candidatus Pacebacteria bacterium]|nr:hypothetical protein [Candidatus Paceibacterota bacterium]MDD2757503.1 hypothetical protein [Candidatus Paceibacterota bacterium]MDD3283642.1 hypothetical protein [Candidatus Paceibacterota bacterium]MDD3969735.1 hypothetical protein [Candidatus Paceibacterota bacterium]MDD4737670.1 hypothetical protein [Candidatus Paceibacterota bacterium]
MNNQEPWEKEETKNPWLEEIQKNIWQAKREENKKIPQREGKLIKEKDTSFFTNNSEKKSIGLIADFIKKEGADEKTLRMFKELYPGRTHLNKIDIQKELKDFKIKKTYNKINFEGEERKRLIKLMSILEELTK